jgi:ATP-binding cassette, subfamily C (CFTR/MRP), member 1
LNIALIKRISGKSTLLSVLLRLVDPSHGDILIDDIDITRMPRNVLRERLICLPQDCLLFAGTFRFNLDPEGKVLCTANFIDVLNKVGLWELVQKRGGLEGELEPDSLSHGEQQLLTFARALLRKDMLHGKCILILDEATSSMDEVAERRLHELVKQEYEKNTVISVAHRMEALRDVDLVLELQNGEILRLEALLTT